MKTDLFGLGCLIVICCAANVAAQPLSDAAVRGQEALVAQPCREASDLARQFRKAAVACMNNGTCVIDIDTLVSKGTRAQTSGATASCLVGIPSALSENAGTLSPQKALDLSAELDSAIARSCHAGCTAQGTSNAPLSQSGRALPVRRSLLSLEKLRTSVALVSGGLDWVDPTRGRSGANMVAVSYSAPIDLTSSFTPTLTPTFKSEPASTLTISASAIRSEPAVSVARAVPATVAGGRYSRSESGSDDPGVTPCQDLRNKVRRLRQAASQCDDDVRKGAPYCMVSVTFKSPSLPSSISPGEARRSAERFDR